MKNINRPNNYRLFSVFICIFAIFLVASCSALTVGNPRCIAEVAPGETITHTMVVSMDGETSAKKLTVGAAEFGLSRTGDYFISDSGKNPYSAKNYISLDKEEFVLFPGQSETVTATISVPENAGAGGRYAIIFIRNIPEGDRMVSIVSGITVPVLLTLEGTALLDSAEISGILVDEAVSGMPLRVTATIRNTGNHHFLALGEVAVYDDTGERVTEVQTKPVMSIPGYDVDLVAAVDTHLNPGKYTAEVTVTRDDGMTVATGSSAFTIAQPYVPPFSEVSITLTPGEEAVLAPPEGSPSIVFPAGSVDYAVEFTLRPVTAALPPPPPGMSPGSVAFEIEAAYGMLSEEATIAVRYGEEDLTAASGEISRLVLARWDKNAKEWKIVPTSADPSIGMLTAKTNRFSVWSVMIFETGASPASAQAGRSAPLPGFLAVTSLSAFALLYFMRRRGGN
jgi:methionine-rich copper-binding protein CopC